MGGRPIRERRRVVDRALESHHFFDTADSYGPTFRVLIAETLHPYPEGLSSHQGGVVRPGKAPLGPDGRPEQSARALTVA